MMDISKVYMVRSAKGNDMLCVDSYLYYYDDMGSSTYRWSCKRRKDKMLPCKSRIITKLIDMDYTKHAVVKVFEEHSHEQCSPEEISKAFERKRIANLAGKPCTLEVKTEIRKMKKDGISGSSEDLSGVEKKRIKIEKLEDTVQDEESRSNENKCQNSTQDGNIFMLKTSHGRDMVCVNGYLYRLEGRAQTSNTYRWECTRRRDDGCKARIQTAHISNSKHVLKRRRFEHTHPPYAQDKLLKLFKKHNINHSENEFRAENKVQQVCESTEDFEEINFANSSKLLQEMLVSSNTDSNIVPAIKDDGSEEPSDFESTIIMDVEQKTEIEKKRIIKDVVGSEDKTKISLKIESGDSADPLEESEGIQADLDFSEICLLPSSKGNQLLCIDKHLYHFDSKSANKQRSYWTCVHRRDKVYNCRGRITTNADIYNGLRILRVSGKHVHANDVERIKQKLQKHGAKTIIRPREISTVSMRKDSNIQHSIKQKKHMNSIYRSKSKKTTKDEDSDSISSLTSDLYSDDDNMDFPELPMKLEHMREAIKEDPNGKTTDMELISELEQPNKIEDDEEYVEYDEDKQQNDFDDEQFEEVHSSFDKKDNVTSEDIISEMDFTKISTLRSAKGGELLCIDNYLYHVKSARDCRTYWECVKCKNKIIKCKSRVITVSTSKGYVVKKVTNTHNHAANRAEVDKRIMKNMLRKNRPYHGNLKHSNIIIRNKTNEISELADTIVIEENLPRTLSKMRKNSAETRSVMKLYSVSDGPPSLAVRMTLKALKIPYELVDINYCDSEHMTEEYAKMNPQKEIPVLDDDGFYLSESIAIMQYLCDKYAPHSSLYPKEPTKRAIVNHRLCFNMGFYYASISEYVMAPIFFDYQRTDISLKKVKNALSVFETYLERSGTKYAAAKSVTIADFPLVTATLCLEAIYFDLTHFPLVKQWYETFKQENPLLWNIGNDGMKEIAEFEKNPPDLSHMNHPFHPTRKPA